MSNVWENNLILIKANKLVHHVYQVTKVFPKSELFGVTSQLRRAALSVVLNVIEGYSRFKPKTHIQFLEIAFGSLKETHYLIEFSHDEAYLSDHDKIELINLCVEIEKMLYAKIMTMKSNVSKV